MTERVVKAFRPDEIVQGCNPKFVIGVIISARETTAPNANNITVFELRGPPAPAGMPSTPLAFANRHGQGVSTDRSSDRSTITLKCWNLPASDTRPFVKPVCISGDFSVNMTDPAFDSSNHPYAVAFPVESLPVFPTN